MAAQPSLAAQRALPYASPTTVPLIQQSQYLADALQSLNEKGSQGFQSWGGFGASLLADALLQHNRRASDAALTGAAKSDMSNLATAMTQGLGGAQSTPSAPAAAPAPAPAQQPVDAALAGPPTQAHAGLSPADRDALANMVYGEARGEPPEGQQAVASVAMNRAAQSGQPLAQVVAAPHQFAGFDPNRTPDPKQLAAVMQNIGGLADGSMPPTTTADHFYAPQGMPGGQPPSWAQGQPAQTIGHQQFLTLNGGQQPPAQPVSQPMGQAPQGAPQAPALQPMAQPPQAAPQQPQGIPTGPGATPQEMALVQSYLHSGNPQMFQQGLQMAAQIRARQAEPVKLAPGSYWGPDGKAHDALQFQDVQGPENAFSQRGPDNQLHVTARPDMGSVPAGMQLQNGRLVPIEGGKTNQFTAGPGSGYAPGTVVERDPMGKASVVQQPEYSPAALGELRSGVLKSEEYKTAVESEKAWEALTQNVGKANGMSAYAIQDTFARAINPGAVARQGTLAAIADAKGVPEGVKSFILNLKGEGTLSPALQQQVLDAVLPFVQANRRAALALNESNTSYAQRHGLNPEDVTAPLAQEPRRYVIPPAAGGNPGPGAGAPAGGYSREALLAEAKRRGLVK